MRRRRPLCSDGKTDGRMKAQRKDKLEKLVERLREQATDINVTADLLGDTQALLTQLNATILTLEDTLLEIQDEIFDRLKGASAPFPEYNP